MNPARLTPYLLVLVTCAAGILPANVTCAEPSAKKPEAAPDRVIVVGELPPAPEVGTTTKVAPSAPAEGRELPTVDASGTPRKAGESRLLTGSFIKQKYELYGNVNNSALNVRTYTQSDLRMGAGPVSGSATVPTLPAGGSPEGMIERTTRHYQLDLRKVAPERRLTVATQLLGEKRGRDFVTKFNRWETAHNKRLAAR